MPVVNVISVVGARPQFVKLAPVVNAFSSVHDCNHSVVHTGQHYDERMSDEFFKLLNLPEPAQNLAVGSAPHGQQTASMLVSLENYFKEHKPHGVLIYGDTNSTLAAVLAATKLNIPVAHIEAGLRSFNRQMPEEINRIAADHCSDKLYAPTHAAMQNLKNENLASRAIFSGDVMRDSVAHFYHIARQKSDLMERLDYQEHQFVLLTLHRPINTSETVLQQLLAVFDKFADTELPVLFPVHPRTRAVIDKLGSKYKNIHLYSPLNYLDMLSCVASARVVVTDSGGLQKEAAFLQTPCITVRKETEWTELIDIGVNRLVGIEQADIHRALIDACRASNPFDESTRSQIDQQYGAGDAAQRIVGDFVHWINQVGNNN